MNRPASTFARQQLSTVSEQVFQFAAMRARQRATAPEASGDLKPSISTLKPIGRCVGQE